MDDISLFWKIIYESFEKIAKTTGNLFKIANFINILHKFLKNSPGSRWSDPGQHFKNEVIDL